MIRNETEPDQFLPRFLSFASEHMPLLPRRVSGSISALLITCREKHSNMIRAQDVLKVIVGMDWTNDMSQTATAKKLA